MISVFRSEIIRKHKWNELINIGNATLRIDLSHFIWKINSENPQTERMEISIK